MLVSDCLVKVEFNRRLMTRRLMSHNHFPSGKNRRTPLTTPLQRLRLETLKILAKILRLVSIPEFQIHVDLPDRRQIPGED